MNYLLGQLEQLGYLVRENAPGNRRSKRIRLTDRDHGAYHLMRSTAEQIEAELENQLGAEDYRHLHELLVRLNACVISRTPVAPNQR